MNTSTLVQKLWNYRNVLRDDGMSYGNSFGQLTGLLFLRDRLRQAGACLLPGPREDGEGEWLHGSGRCRSIKQTRFALLSHNRQNAFFLMT